MSQEIAGAPIGMFDSGVGGLTVFHRVSRLLPHENIVYIADQKNVPYGGRPLDEIRAFATGLAHELYGRGCKALVMACNISSATALDEVAARHPTGITLGMIHPGAAAAAVRTRSGRIGVLATAGTVASGAYVDAFARMNPNLAVTQVACPDFVPLVERDEVDGPEATNAAVRYLAPLLAAGVDTVVLGCTHYPYLLGVLKRIARDRITFVDPAEHTARALADRLARRGLLATVPTAAADGHAMLTTGPLPVFAAQLERLLPNVAYRASRVDYRPLSRSRIPETETPSFSDILSRSPSISS